MNNATQNPRYYYNKAKNALIKLGYSEIDIATFLHPAKKAIETQYPDKRKKDIKAMIKL